MRKAKVKAEFAGEHMFLNEEVRVGNTGRELLDSTSQTLPCKHQSPGDLVKMQILIH